MFETILCLAGGGLDSPEQGTKERLLAFGGRDAFLLQLRRRWRVCPSIADAPQADQSRRQHVCAFGGRNWFPERHPPLRVPGVTEPWAEDPGSRLTPSVSGEQRGRAFAQTNACRDQAAKTTSLSSVRCSPTSLSAFHSLLFGRDWA